MLSLLVFPALMAAASLPFSSAIPHPLRPSSASQHRELATRQDSGTGYAQPESWLTVIPNSNLGEPINVVISSQSDQAVLSDTGLQSYFSSLFFSPNNCLGISLGDQQAANLNDGQGVVNQTALYRYNFGSGTLTCQESINGGEHFRWWRQSSTGAIFIAASVEMGASKNHMIVDNG
ncbi:hypothetical protein BDZ90DRAFT_157477 [Jaminaea rosea]|uniref:Uncharacterized protein n=1 Tax=Jaminaea rosea TaxID=1569628 RepID=A0A316URJ5_9BASI|nr:hypothetical protein BDZ90DRAFT_157477 [Jaminaea rosea]PWN27940.1 hypothetical protein BDZ90DRAFT_157477 [Jaminaea rosea]